MTAGVKALEKQLEQLKSRMASRMGDTLLEKAVEVKGVKVLAAAWTAPDAKALRETMDKVKDKLGTAAAVLAAVSPDGRVQLAAGVTRDLTDRIKAGELVNFVAQKLGGKGGGKPTWPWPAHRPPTASRLRLTTSRLGSKPSSEARR